MTAELAIIGGGVSGAFVVLQCLRQAGKPLHILWFDKEGLFCKGLAYSTTEEAHLLNVRASNMSAFADEPGHFTNWLKARGYGYTGADFVPRMIYGLYVSETLNTLKQQHPFVTVTELGEEVVSVTRHGHRFKIAAKEVHEALRLVLAAGNFLPGHPRSSAVDFISSPYYFRNAFDKQLLDARILAKEKITILGSGLTMLDLVMALQSRQYQGQICVLSPHGYLPRAHSLHTVAVESFIGPEKSYRLSEVFALVRKQLKQAQREGRDPYGVIDSLRPHVQRLWLGFSFEEQRRFLRHLRHKWGVARHRAPSESIASVHEAISAGKLQVMKGRISRIDLRPPEGFRIRYRDENGEEAIWESDVIVNCTGPEPDIHKIDSPLLKQLIHSGLIEGHDLSYGLKAPETGELSEGFYTIGPLLKGVLWESTAVPEIRLQAAVLAGKIISG